MYKSICKEETAKKDGENHHLCVSNTKYNITNSVHKKDTSLF